MVNVAMNQRKPRLGEQLVADGIISEEQLEQALAHHQEKGNFLSQALVSLGFVTAGGLALYIERTSGYPFVELAVTAIEHAVAQMIPEALARKKVLLPFAEVEQGIKVALADPLDLATVDNLRAMLGRRILPHVAVETDIQEAIGRVYDGHLKTQTVLAEIAEVDSAEETLSVDTLVGLAEDAPIVRLVNSILQAAVAAGASDIHIEPQENIVRVRFRQDGLLYEHTAIPKHHLKAVVSRLKIVAQLNIAEHRRPQDGRFMIKDSQGRQFDLRVSIMPVIYGEKIVMRLLAKSSSYANSDTLGFFPDQKRLFEQFIRRPHGIILVTGPTGSGKSTTLFAALNQINDSTRNINTVEDPVEYNLPGVNQMQVNPNIGVTFAAGLRTLLRQDPDVVMVGEIRDKETAEIAIQAALTGHLVLSTLHTNDATGALTRLQNMGIEPFLISSALIGVIGQRLLRTICKSCCEARPATRATIEALGLPVTTGATPVLAYGKGCAKCGQRGMKGRTAVYELMPMTDKLREMVLQNTPTAHIRAQAITEGMRTMRDSGVQKVMQGITTPEEVIRVLFSEDF